MASLLHENDQLGRYPNSYYAASVTAPAKRAKLQDRIRADVCIVGAGFTGLSAALSLAAAGRKVVVLDAHRVGWGASGRNGGQLGSGQRVEQPELEDMLGFDQARALWDLAQGAKAYVKDVIARHEISCDLTPGIAHVNHRKRYDADSRALVDHMAKTYDYPLHYLPPHECADLVRSRRYSGGTLDMDAAHLHPLKYALGLASAAEQAGAEIYEESEVTKISRNDPAGGKTSVHTATGQVTADEIIIAGNGYIEGLEPRVAAKVMPINNYILATEPLSEAQQRGIIAQDIAVADSKFVVNYYRFSKDGRLLFGGRESYGYKFPRDVAGFVRKAMVGIFPQTQNLAIDYGWGGTLAITMSRLPFLRELEPGLWNASGYSGHGVGMASFSGHLIAQAIMGQRDRFDKMAAIPATSFPGGAKMRAPLLAGAMLWYALRDRI